MPKENAQASIFLDQKPTVRIHPEISDEGLTPQRENELVRLAIGGCDESFGALYDTHKTKVYRHLYYMVGNASDAEDMTSTTFEKAYKAIPRYEVRGAPFVSWLLRIAHNQGVTHLRSKKVAGQLHDGLLDSANVEDEVVRDVDQEGQTRAIDKAISGLPSEQADVIRMRFLEEKDYKEVAEAIGKTVAAVRVIQWRALRKLRDPMDAYLNDENYSDEGVA